MFEFRIKYSLFIIAVAAMSPLVGQQVGVTIGVGLSKYNFRQVNWPTYVSQYESFEHTPILSTYAGVDLKSELTENVFFALGLSYSMIGNRQRTVFNSYNPSNPDSTVQMKQTGIYRQHYFNIPVTVHFPKLYLFVGGQVSYLFLVRTQYHSEDTHFYNGNVTGVYTDNGRGTFDLSTFKYFNRFDFGGIVGVEYPIFSRSTIALRYYQGLNGVLNEDFFINYKNSQLLLTFSYRLNKESGKKTQ